VFRASDHFVRRGSNLQTGTDLAVAPRVVARLSHGQEDPLVADELGHLRAVQLPHDLAPRVRQRQLNAPLVQARLEVLQHLGPARVDARNSCR
jgi:hypothetical protein